MEWLKMTFRQEGTSAKTLLIQKGEAGGNMQQGSVFNVQRFTIHDGPGMRTELFLKGCPLRCRWCSNPEGQLLISQPGVYSSRCIGPKSCGACLQSCPRKEALIFENNVLSSIDRDLCNDCMACCDVCPADAIRRWGDEMTVEECMEIIRRDRSYYDESGGGVTVSGGEPLLQSSFVKALFSECREEGIHTCLESTLCVPWERVLEVLPETDLVIADLKMMDSKKHLLNTGVGNEQILSNLKALSEKSSRIILRIPVIPGVNDDDDNIRRSADFIQDEMHGAIECLQLLSFMFLGEEKYQSLGMPYPMKALKFDRESFQKRVEEIAQYFLSRKINCTIGNKSISHNK